MKYKLVTFKKDYADEFNVHGIVIMTLNDLSNYLAIAKQAKYPIEMGFGTNECLDFHDFSDLEASLQWRDISSETADQLNDLFGGDSFGWFPEDIAKY